MSAFAGSFTDLRRVDALRDEGLLRPWADAPAPDAALLGQAIDHVTFKVAQNLPRFTQRFPAPSSVGGVYAQIDNIEWTTGFWTGMLWLAYEVSGDLRYRQAAEIQVVSFQRRVRERVEVDHHDLGFLYSLSCVSAYKLTGDTDARAAAMEAARLLLRRYLPSAGVIQAWGDLSDPAQRGRMIIDCNMNLPLLYWATEQSGDASFAAAANQHLERAAAFLVRDDASTFHTFHVDAETGAPLHGSTHQGHSDTSCWSRGQAWGIYGFALGFRHLRDPRLLLVARRLANYFLNRLPDDLVCHWDLVFTRGDQPRDSSAAAIAACGLLELADALPDEDRQRPLYRAAAAAIVNSLARDYTTSREAHDTGVLKHAVYHLPKNIGVDESCIWGDYFYFEALRRLQGPWPSYW
jgi:unsaturated chondroitin disaccharide hydrolase